MGPIMCACPGRSKPLGSASSCEEACYGKSSSGGGGSGASDTVNALTPYIQQGIEQLFKGEDPAVAAERRERELRQAIEAARIQKEKDDRMDAEAGSLLRLTEAPKIVGDDELLRDAPKDTKPKIALKPVPKISLSRENFARQSDKSSGRAPTSLVACGEGDETSFHCSDGACAAEGKPACCPKSHPFLNHCNCQCFFSSYDIKDCSSYTSCKHTWRPQ